MQCIRPLNPPKTPGGSRLIQPHSGRSSSHDERVPTKPFLCLPARILRIIAASLQQLTTTAETQRRLNTSALSTLNKRPVSGQVFKVGEDL